MELKWERQDFNAFENGNASISIAQEEPGRHHVQMQMGFAAFIMLYASTEELAELRDTLWDYVGNAD